MTLPTDEIANRSTPLPSPASRPFTCDEEHVVCEETDVWVGWKSTGEGDKGEMDDAEGIGALGSGGGSSTDRERELSTVLHCGWAGVTHWLLKFCPPLNDSPLALSVTMTANWYCPLSCSPLTTLEEKATGTSPTAHPRTYTIDCCHLHSIVGVWSLP